MMISKSQLLLFLTSILLLITTTYSSSFTLDSFSYPTTSSLNTSWYQETTLFTHLSPITINSDTSFPYYCDAQSTTVYKQGEGMEHCEYYVGFSEEVMYAREDLVMDLSGIVDEYVFEIDVWVRNNIDVSGVSVWLFDGDANYCYYGIDLKPGWVTYTWKKTDLEGGTQCENLDWSDIQKIRFKTYADCSGNYEILPIPLFGYFKVKNFKMVEYEIHILKNTDYYYHDFAESISNHLAHVKVPSMVFDHFNYSKIIKKNILILGTCFIPKLNQSNVDDLVDYVTNQGKKILLYQDCFHEDRKLPDTLRNLFQIEYQEWFSFKKFIKISFNKSMEISKYVPEIYPSANFLCGSIINVDNGDSKVLAYYDTLLNGTDIPAVIQSNIGVIFDFYMNNYPLAEKIDYIMMLIDLVDQSFLNIYYEKFVYRVETFSDYGLNNFAEFIDLISDSNVQKSEIKDAQKDYDDIYDLIDESSFREAALRSILLYHKMEDLYVKSIYPERELKERAMYIHGISNYETLEQLNARMIDLHDLGYTNVNLNIPMKYFTAYEDYSELIDGCVQGANLFDDMKCSIWLSQFSITQYPSDVKDQLVQMTSYYSSLDPKSICPRNQTNVKLVHDIILDLLNKSSVDGIHLDYIRYKLYSCFCDHCKALYQNFTDDVVDFDNCCVYPTYPHFIEHNDWKIKPITDFVNGLFEKFGDKKVHYSASVRRPTELWNAGQNISYWNMDEFTYMTYEKSYLDFQKMLRTIDKLRKVNYYKRTKHLPLIHTSKYDFPFFMRLVHETFKKEYSFDGHGIFCDNPSFVYYISPKLKRYYSNTAPKSNDKKRGLFEEYLLYIAIVCGIALALFLIFLTVAFTIMFVKCNNKKKTKIKNDNIELELFSSNK